MSLSHPLPRKLHPTVGHPGISTSHCTPGLASSTRHLEHTTAVSKRRRSLPYLSAPGRSVCEWSLKQSDDRPRPHPARTHPPNCGPSTVVTAHMAAAAFRFPVSLNASTAFPSAAGKPTIILTALHHSFSSCLLGFGGLPAEIHSLCWTFCVRRQGYRARSRNNASSEWGRARRRPWLTVSRAEPRDARAQPADRDESSGARSGGRAAIPNLGKLPQHSFLSREAVHTLQTTGSTHLGTIHKALSTRYQT